MAKEEISDKFPPKFYNHHSLGRFKMGETGTAVPVDCNNYLFQLSCARELMKLLVVSAYLNIVMLIWISICRSV